MRPLPLASVCLCAFLCSSAAAAPASAPQFIQQVDLNNTPFRNHDQWHTMTHWLPEDLWQQFHPQAAVQDDVNGLRSGCTNNDFGSGTTPEPAVTKPRALQSPQFPVMVPVTIFSVL